MPNWQTQSGAERLAQLRAAVAQARNNLIEVEADRVDQLAEVNAFEFLFEARVGHLLDTLTRLTEEVGRYNERIQMVRNKQIFGYAYRPADQQFRRTWQPPAAGAPTPPATSPGPDEEARIKQLYRHLARRFHPDLARDEAERSRRTEKMAAVNDAYAARSLTELEALAQETPATIDLEALPAGQTTDQLIQALESELDRCQRRLREIELDVNRLHLRPSVQLSLEVKLARHRGRDLLAEIATDVERKIARQTAERDLLKAQLDQLGPDLWQMSKSK
jgi:hypothetical protein